MENKDKDTYTVGNVFDKILNHNADVKKCYEDHEFLVLYDNNPRYPLHLLLIPKRKFVSFDDFIKDKDMGHVARYY